MQKTSFFKKSTCIYNIYYNTSFEQNVKSGIFLEKISDHFPILIVTSQKPTKISQTKQVIYKRTFTKNSKNEFNKRIMDMSWNTILNCKNVDDAYDKFLDEFTDTYEQMFPIKKFELKPKEILNKWMTRGLLKSSRKKQILYQKYLKNKNNVNESNYKKYTRIFNKLKEKCKRTYYSKT